jgi:glycosyltransferase involved in cell wall biosynthesis
LSHKDPNLTSRIKLAIVSTHPIQYYSPWFRYLASEAVRLRLSLGLRNEPANELKFEVFYAHRQTAKGQADAGFGVEFEWDVPVLEGYTYQFLKNVSKRPGLDWFGGCDCPEIGEILVRERFTHVLLIGWHKKVFWQAFWAAKKAGIKVLSRGDSHLGKQGNPLKIITKEILYRILLPCFDAHLYVGHRNREYLKHYGVKNARLFFSPHFVDNEWWGANAERSRAGGNRWEVERGQKAESDPPSHKASEGLRWKAEKSVEFLFAGKFTEEKRPQDPLLALKEVPDARLVYVGDGTMRRELKKICEECGLTERVEFLGFKNQKELPAILAGAECLILPGNESWGLVVNEAMACGTPAIVSTACGCAPDLIDEGETGYSFPMGSTRALADRMRLFIKNRSRGWDENVRAKVSRFSISKATDGLFRALEVVSS